MTEAELFELFLLQLPDDKWDRFRMMHNEDGVPLVSTGANGQLVINDPLLAKWDAEARANAAALDAKLNGGGS